MFDRPYPLVSLTGYATRRDYLAERCRPTNKEMPQERMYLCRPAGFCALFWCWRIVDEKVNRPTITKEGQQD
jgi:hypothetical protein